MKTIVKFLGLLVFSNLFISCEDVVDIPLDTERPKLVIDAVIKWKKGTTGKEQMIKLSTTTNFYSNVIPPVSNAIVTVSNSSNTVFNFIENNQTGIYVCSNFEPVINEEYTLKVVYNNQIYISKSKLLATPKIDYEQQVVVPDFGGKDRIQVKFFFQDNGQEDNFYLVGLKNSATIFQDYGVIDDKFFQGNQMFGFYTDKDLKAGDQLHLFLQGITQEYGNYMNKLLSISGAQGGSPFSTPPATLRGNIVNQNNPTDFPFGYFSLGEVDEKMYQVQ